MEQVPYDYLGIEEDEERGPAASEGFPPGDPAFNMGSMPPGHDAYEDIDPWILETVDDAAVQDEIANPQNPPRTYAPDEVAAVLPTPPQSASYEEHAAMTAAAQEEAQAAEAAELQAMQDEVNQIVAETAASAEIPDLGPPNAADITPETPARNATSDEALDLEGFPEWSHGLLDLGLGIDAMPEGTMPSEIVDVQAAIMSGPNGASFTQTQVDALRGAILMQYNRVKTAATRVDSAGSAQEATWASARAFEEMKRYNALMSFALTPERTGA